MLFVMAVLPAQEFGLVANGAAVPILLDGKDATVVHKAAQLLVQDVASITGVAPALLTDIPQRANALIIAGTMDSRHIQKLSAQHTDHFAHLRGKWEHYDIREITNPFKGVSKALLIVGSDRRGTAYGILELSRRMGISPWVWWADVAPEQRADISIPLHPTTFKGPSVKYRGVFLNDEDWGLERWASLTYEPEVGDMGPRTYAKIFELLLRLRANTIWPAMHSSTEPFYSFPNNKKVADDYAIVIGTSHAEPMLSNINTEWDHKTMGEYRYDTNAANIKALFSKRVKETAAYEGIYTMGMRGEHDSPMIVGEDDTAAQVQLLQQVIGDQRALLERSFKKDPRNVPQAFIPYKEVLDYYQNGLELPEDITLVWTDDNYGYIRQLSTEAEQQRSGGAGVYYHTSYWGRPHDYLWLNSTHPVLLWSEMSKAFSFGAEQQWILNCGDIKPHEYNTELFLDMAWDMDGFKTSDSVTAHLNDWVATKFGPAQAQAITDLLMENNRLSFIRRPEFMAWSQVEPVTKNKQTQMTQLHYGDEVSLRTAAYENLMSASHEIYQNIPEHLKDAFFQLVHYPVAAAANHNLKWLYHYKNAFSAKQGRASALWFAKKATKAHENVQELTAHFNSTIKQGKWRHMMNASPRYLPVFDAPLTLLPRENTEKGLGLALEGYEMEANTKTVNSFANVLPVFSAYTKNRYFIDLFGKGDTTLYWKAIPKDPWIQLSQITGHLTAQTPEERLWVSLDWPTVPQALDRKEPPLGHDHQLIPPSYKVNSAIDFISGKDTITVGVSAYNPKFAALENYTGFVEDKGFVSIHAEHFSKSKKGVGASWEKYSGLGYSGAVMAALPSTAVAQVSIADILANSPSLSYDFYTFNFGTAKVYVRAVPTHPQHKDYGVRIAVAIDGSEPVIMDLATFGRSGEWKENVLRNMATGAVDQVIDRAGPHTLTLWMVDPGLLLDKVLIDLGGWKDSYDFPDETKMK